MKTIKSFNVSWQADHNQYYQGHSTVFTDYTHSGQGVGETLREAFEDALEQLAEQDIDVNGELLLHDSEIYKEMRAELTSQVKAPEMLDWDIVKSHCPTQGEHKKECFHDNETDSIWVKLEDCVDCKGTGERIDEDPDCAVCAGDWNFYVNVDVQAVEASKEETCS